MTLMKNGSVRCDYCGKLSRREDGGYRISGDVWGYIRAAKDYFGIAGASDSFDACEACGERAMTTREAK